MLELSFSETEVGSSMSSSDAELSVSLSHEEAAKTEANQAREKVRQLEEESKLPKKGENP